MATTKKGTRKTGAKKTQRSTKARTAKRSTKRAAGRPKDLEAVIKCVRLITRAVADHYRMHPRDRNRLEGEALVRVRELAAQFGTPEENVTRSCSKRR